MTQLPKTEPAPLDADFAAWLQSLSLPTQCTARRLVVDNKVQADDAILGWFAVELVGDEQLRLEKFDSYQALVDHVYQRAQQDDVRMFCHWGSPVRLTKGPLKFIVHPSGERTPLFRVPDETEMEFDDRGEFTDPPHTPIDEVTQMSIAGQVFEFNPTSRAPDGSPDEFDTTDYEEYDEVEGDQDYSEEEPDDMDLETEDDDEEEEEDE